MKEYDVIKVIDEALEAISSDHEAQLRVLEWAMKKFGDGNIQVAREIGSGGTDGIETAEIPQGNQSGGELPGIALITDSGDFRFTVRDIKAKNTNDAAIRLALVSIWAYCKLTGEKSASSRRIVKPILEDWRAYTGNTRREISMHQGILRSGDALSLDQHARREAELIVEEILRPETSGRWSPFGKKRKAETRTEK